MADSKQPKFLVYAPSDVGGLAEHINYQVRELVKRGIQVDVLATNAFMSHNRPSYRISYVLLGKVAFGNRYLKGAFNVLGDIINFYVLAWYVIFRRPTVVFTDSYSEYFSPFWVWPHLLFSRVCGVTYATNLHDPVRDFRIGPVWFHDLSNRLVFAIYSVLLIHEKLPAECRLSDRIQVHEVPVGVYETTAEIDSSETFPSPISVPENGRLFLSYGFLRDNKNLDLFIRAMVEQPDAYLIVAGRNQSTKDKGFPFYEALAEECGVKDRIHFDEGFISEAKTDYYFRLCDYIVLTYDKSFRSQSGVVNIAANYKKPVIASSGSSPLQKCVEDYSLGVFCEPDSLDGLTAGLARLLSPDNSVEPDWNGYVRYASWNTNIEILLNALK